MSTTTIDTVGEIIAWTPPSGAVKIAFVRGALASAGFDPDACKELRPLYAFQRAVKALEEDRLIEPVPSKDVAGTMAYQFTRRAEAVVTDLRPDGTTGDFQTWAYSTEATIWLDKESGKVWCKDAALNAQVQALVNAKLGEKTATDITRLVQRLCRDKADLFPVREQGGAYFAPNECLPFVDKIGTFLAAVGGRVTRFKVAGSSGSVAQVVSDGLAAAVKEHEEAVDGFDASTLDGSLEEAAERINTTRLKVEAYASYLQDKKVEMEAAVDAAKAKLAAKVAAIVQEKEDWKDGTYKVALGATE